MLLKVAVEKNTSTGDITWHNLYANSIRLRLRKDYNLFDVPDKKKARENLGVTDAIRIAKEEAINECKNYTDKEIRWLDDRLGLQVKFNLDNIKQIRKEFGLWIPSYQDVIDQWNDTTYESIDLSTESGVRDQGFTENESIHIQSFAKILNARSSTSDGAIDLSKITDRFWFTNAENSKPSNDENLNFVEYVHYVLKNAKTYIDDENTTQNTEWNRRYNELKEWITNEINVLTNWMVARFADWQYAIAYVLLQERAAVNSTLSSLTTTYNTNFSNVKADIENIKTDLHSLYTETRKSDQENENYSKAIINLLNQLIPNLDKKTYIQDKTIAKNIALWVWKDRCAGMMLDIAKEHDRIDYITNAFLKLMDGNGALQFLNTKTEEQSNEYTLWNGEVVTGDNAKVQILQCTETGKKIWIA